MCSKDSDPLFVGGSELSFPWGGGTTPNSGTGGGGGSGGSVDHSELPLSAVDARVCEEIGGCRLGV